MRIRHCDAGFAVGQVIVDEAELFLIMTKPEHRKQGLGTVFWQRLNNRRFKTQLDVSF